MNIGISKKYVSLSDNTRLLIYTHQAVLIKNGNVRVVNDDATKVLRKCDGTLTVEDLLESISSDPGGYRRRYCNF